MINFLRQLIVLVPDQIVSTMLLFGFGYTVYRGAIAIWDAPPSFTTCIVVILIGVALGIVTSCLNEKTNQKNVDKNEMDR